MVKGLRGRFRAISGVCGKCGRDDLYLVSSDASRFLLAEYLSEIIASEAFCWEL